MKKKNGLLTLAFMLAATLTMALTSPMSAKAEKFEPVSLVDRKTESNLYGGMILPQLPVATTATEEYNLVDQSDEPATEQVRSYYVKNSHGDIIGQVDEYGNLLNSYAYNAFGELVAAVTIQPETTKNTSRFLYAGEQYDETSGLYYLRARCYDTDAGRFTQEDTYLGDGRNLYAYTHSNPLKYVDPSGHAVVTCKDDGRMQDDFQERNMAGGGGGIHGNSLSYPGTNYGYALVNRSTNEILKFGETIHPNTRYTQSYLNNNNAVMKVLESGNKADIHSWQYDMNNYYKDRYGEYPLLNCKGW